ncbi:hypothetical protein Celly_1148 [Cellulophaga lytica DSM 7489]|uniref:Uncharacterized protein n=1 Tax=Cellulophaga lytica (strain ATCC 23178 / DSM 7489 / JCM 8516 / NBRC 14961 / NCIMB 1423 / VKM B-1433 / Cy l20) TaxID=867900 RepID=F0RFM8_CELLC|nr:hypothetical protein Celly_1148 [Cellulophaga lytica DSM 7489]
MNLNFNNSQSVNMRKSKFIADKFLVLTLSLKLKIDVK